MKRRNRDTGAGFTLIELLMVITIITLLASMVIPSLMNCILLAKRVSCVGRLGILGQAATGYQADFHNYVPVCWGNLPANQVNPWKSWRTNLLPYVNNFQTFNCPSAKAGPATSETFHSDSEITGHDKDDTINAGSYGVIYQFSLPSYKAVNSAGVITQGHPCWSCAFPTRPGVAWMDPGNSVYLADACFTYGPLTYPSQSYKDNGTSAVMAPSDNYFQYFGQNATRRFADRHAGTNCLFLDGRVVSYRTSILDNMVAGNNDCVWDTQ